ncbi:hypothetical protein POJ91_003915 [Salmonella enterica]|nr:hypothetical protein [Salmonella enterica]
MMINKQGNAVNLPDLSRLYIISGRMMFDDEEEVMLVEAGSSGEAEAAFRRHIADREAHIEKALVISSASLQSLLPDRIIVSALTHTL